jgi:hypothetical protein
MNGTQSRREDISRDCQELNFCVPSGSLSSPWVDAALCTRDLARVTVEIYLGRTLGSPRSR